MLQPRFNGISVAKNESEGKRRKPHSLRKRKEERARKKAHTKAKLEEEKSFKAQSKEERDVLRNAT